MDIVSKEKRSDNTSANSSNNSNANISRDSSSKCK